MSMDYTKTQPYRLGKMYKELGEMLMDERTDMRDLVAVAHTLGVNISVSLGEPKPEGDNYALAP